jgi:hypothetical protein
MFKRGLLLAEIVLSLMAILFAWWGHLELAGMALGGILATLKDLTEKDKP